MKIIVPPEDTTACNGSNVIISCGYECANALLPVTWMINGEPFTQKDIMSNLLYHINNPTNPKTMSITLSNINHTTTFQCIVQSTPNIISTLGTVTKITGK